MPRPPQPASRSQCRPNFGRLRRIWAGPTAKSAGSSAAGWIVAAVFAVASGAPTTPATAQEGPQDTEGEARLEAIAYELRTATREESARAVELGQEALELLGPESPESLELRLTCGLCRARHWNDEFETGIALGGRCVELAERLEDRYWLASGLLWCLGQGYSRTGQPGLAAAHQVRAVKIYEEIGPPRQLATALTRAGMDLSDLGDPTQAFDFQLRALEIFTQTGDTNGQAQALLRIGSVHLRNGDHERALEYSRRAYNAFASIDYDVGAAAALHNVGVANMQLERYDRALELLEESLAIKRRLGQPRSVALCLLNIGLAQAERDRADLALPMIQEAIATLREIGANRELASALIYAARVRFTSGDFDGALSAVQESITTAESIGTESTNAEAYELLAELEEARGDLAAALAALRRHQELASQVLNEANSRQLTQMEARYQAESQAREIQELKEQKALKDLEFEHQRNVRTALVIGFGLLLAVLALLFNRYRLRAQTQRMAEAVEHEKAVSASLRRVDRLKDDFLANTSHELRTPLFGIVGLAEALLDDDATPLPAEARKNLELILQSGNRLNALVADILDSAKLRRRELELTRSSVSLHSLVDVVLTLSRPLVDGRDIQLKNDVSAGTPPVLADADRIQQVLHNLIGNAIKFTESGEVRVRAEVTGDGLRIAVDDTGIGIPEEHLDKIFNSFEQADASIERSYGGTGLGLAISRQLVRLHGGELQVSSTPGEGTTFFFTLPLAEEGTPVADVDVSGDLSRIPAPALLAEDGDPADPERETPPGDRPNRGGPTHDGPDGDGPVILTIDDEPVNQQVLKNHLVHHGHRVVSASSGPEALDLMARESVDLVLLDIMMPRMSGYEVCRRIRAEHSREDLPVIFLSAKNRAADRVAGFEEGGNDYLAKPIAKPELLKRVDTQLELLRSHRTQAEELKILRGLLTICSGCKRIRDDERGWGPLEAFIDRHSEASFTHGLCPSCVTTLYPDIAIDVEDSR